MSIRYEVADTLLTIMIVGYFLLSAKHCLLSKRNLRADDYLDAALAIGLLGILAFEPSIIASIASRSTVLLWSLALLILALYSVIRNR